LSKRRGKTPKKKASRRASGNEPSVRLALRIGPALPKPRDPPARVYARSETRVVRQTRGSCELRCARTFASRARHGHPGTARASCRRAHPRRARVPSIGRFFNNPVCRARRG
jgi:hypothetical protein